MIQLRDALAENVLQSRDLLKRYLAGFDDTNLTAQPGGPGGLPNHVAWTLGHLAITMSRAIEKIDGTPPDAGDFFTGEPRQGDRRRFNTEMVSFGSAPTPEAHQYPPLSRCVEIFDNCCKRLSDKARAATDAELEKMVPWGAIQIAGWQVIMRMAFHNGMHTGQIADTRRALRMKSIFS